MILVDTNVLLDIATNDPRWADWSIRQLEVAALLGRLVVNDIAYAEFSVRFERIEAVDAFIDEGGFQLEATPRAGLFLAGKAFAAYRARGGTRSGVLPDFLSGAHAAVAGYDLLTRDAARYRTYFPSVRLLVPSP